MKYSLETTPAARVFFVGAESVYPGWYLQHYVNCQLNVDRLEVDPDVDAYTAATEAASLIGCERNEIQVEGAPWPDYPLPA